LKDHRTIKAPSAVRVFTAQAAVVEHDVSTVDVIAEAPPAESQTVLAVSLLDAFQFPDAMLTAPVVRIGAEDGDSVRIRCGELGVTIWRGRGGVDQSAG